MTSHQEWYRDSYLISTAPNLIQPAVVNAAFDSDDMYWTKALPEESLKQMLSKSLCFGLYQLPTTSSELAGKDLSDPMPPFSNYFPFWKRAEEPYSDWSCQIHHR